MTRTAQYMTQNEIKKRFNTTKLVISGNLIQVQDFLTKEYHYLIENTFGWNDSGMTSLAPQKDLTTINPEFFTQLVEEQGLSVHNSWGEDCVLSWFSIFLTN